MDVWDHLLNVLDPMWRPVNMFVEMNEAFDPTGDFNGTAAVRCQSDSLMPLILLHDDTRFFL